VDDFVVLFLKREQEKENVLLHNHETVMAALEMSERQTVTCATGMCARAFKTSSTSCGDSRNTQSHNYQSPGAQQHSARSLPKDKYNPLHTERHRPTQNQPFKLAR